MAQVKLPSDIESLSGKLGSVIFRTFRKADGTTETRMYKNPYWGRDRPAKKSKLSDKEIANRRLFKEVSQEVTLRQESGDKRRRGVIFKEVYAQKKAQKEGDSLR